MSSSPRGLLAVLTTLTMIAVTLYLALAFPYTLFSVKQKETSELKAVIMIARSGESTPSLESYFIGEEPPSELVNELGFEQLHRLGRERMYLLGKFLKLKYYDRLLEGGSPRKLEAHACHAQRCIESAQALLAGLLPAQDSQQSNPVSGLTASSSSWWRWLGSDELAGWQPVAVRSTDWRHDDMLSSEDPPCLRIIELAASWKNSSRYAQLLGEFRHDLASLRQNTGLEFEDDLEMLNRLDVSLRARDAMEPLLAGSSPSWYTPTLARRLSHIADVAGESRFSLAEMQRLYAGRLVHEIIRIIRQKMASNMASNSERRFTRGRDSACSPTPSPSVHLFVTERDRLAALMSALQIYSSIPSHGALLLVELHYDPMNAAHFLRLFTLSSNDPSVLPEPLRVNPVACSDGFECLPDKFEANLKSLALDSVGWQDACQLDQPARPLLDSLFPATPTRRPATPSQPSAVTSTPIPTPASTTANIIDLRPPTTSQRAITETEDLIVGPLKLPTEKPREDPVSAQLVVVVNEQESSKQVTTLSPQPVDLVTSRSELATTSSSKTIPELTTKTVVIEATTTNPSIELGTTKSDKESQSSPGDVTTISPEPGVEATTTTPVSIATLGAL